MTIHEKALEIIASCSGLKSVQTSDSVDSLKNDADIIKSLNSLYNTEVIISNVHWCGTVSDLLSIWERKTTLDVNEPFDKVQSLFYHPHSHKAKIDISGVAVKKDMKQLSDLSTLKICISKRAKLYILLLLIPIWLIFYSLYLYARWWMFFCYLFSGFLQLCVTFVALNEMSVVEEQLIVSYSELPKYYKEERNYGYLLLTIGIIIQMVSFFPFYAMNLKFVNFLGSYNDYEGGFLVTLMVIFVTLINCALFYNIIGWFYKTSKSISKEIDKFKELINKQKQKNLAKNYELSTNENIVGSIKDTTAHSLYLIFDQKTRGSVDRIINELNLHFNKNVTISYPKTNATVEEKEEQINQADVILCIIDTNFVHSEEAMQDLIISSNLNKTILAGYLPNTVLPSNIIKYIRRELHSLDEIHGYNSLVLELLPLVGCSEPLADAVGAHYELHVNSRIPYVISFDDKNYNFNSSQTIHLFFASGSHNILIYNTKDIMIKRSVIVSGCKTLSRKSYYVDRIDLDGIVIERKQLAE